MTDQQVDIEVSLRPASQVMKLARMGSFHQTRLSFMRALLREISQHKWQFKCMRWEVDDVGSGVAVYAAKTPTHTYSLICYAHDLPAEKRSDRVIAEQWDATFTLFDGVPTDQDIRRLADNVPKQEAGRYQATELVLARANRSVRLFEHVVESLAQGRQPNKKMIDSIGYLMRTTAVYGNGKFGISDRSRIAERAELSAPFRAEMLCVWMIRWFTLDMVNHLARVRGQAGATELDGKIRRTLGVGNATGLGMAPFLILHPSLIHQWILARETALQRVRSLQQVHAQDQQKFRHLLERAMHNVHLWQTADSRQQKRIEMLKQDIQRIKMYMDTHNVEKRYFWNNLVIWSAQNLGLEGQEFLVSLVIEPYGALVDDLANQMSQNEEKFFKINGAQSIKALSEMIEKNYPWSLDVDFTKIENQSKFWYVSEEKLEPRLGERFSEPGKEKEHPLSYGRDVAELFFAVQNFISTQSKACVADFLLRYPQYRHSVRRVQIASQLPYAEIQDNLIASDIMPIDLLRCKLSFFGATRFDPRSDRWVRINMYQYAPFPDEYSAGKVPDSQMDDWCYPALHEDNE